MEIDTPTASPLQEGENVTPLKTKKARRGVAFSDNVEERILPPTSPNENVGTEGHNPKNATEAMILFAKLTGSSEDKYGSGGRAIGVPTEETENNTAANAGAPLESNFMARGELSVVSAEKRVDDLSDGNAKSVPIPGDQNGTSDFANCNDNSGAGKTETPQNAIEENALDPAQTGNAEQSITNESATSDYKLDRENRYSAAEVETEGLASGLPYSTPNVGTSETINDANTATVEYQTNSETSPREAKESPQDTSGLCDATTADDSQQGEDAMMVPTEDKPSVEESSDLFSEKKRMEPNPNPTESVLEVEQLDQQEENITHESDSLKNGVNKQQEKKEEQEEKEGEKKQTTEDDEIVTRNETHPSKHTDHHKYEDDCYDDYSLDGFHNKSPENEAVSDHAAIPPLSSAEDNDGLLVGTTSVGPSVDVTAMVSSAALAKDPSKGDLFEDLSSQDQTMTQDSEPEQQERLKQQQQQEQHQHENQQERAKIEDEGIAEEEGELLEEIASQVDSQVSMDIALDDEEIFQGPHAQMPLLDQHLDQKAIESQADQDGTRDHEAYEDEGFASSENSIASANEAVSSAARGTASTAVVSLETRTVVDQAIGGKTASGMPPAAVGLRPGVPPFEGRDGDGDVYDDDFSIAEQETIEAANAATKQAATTSTTTAATQGVGDGGGEKGEERDAAVVGIAISASQEAATAETTAETTTVATTAVVGGDEQEEEAFASFASSSMDSQQSAKARASSAKDPSSRVDKVRKWAPLKKTMSFRDPTEIGRTHSDSSVDKLVVEGEISDPSEGEVKKTSSHGGVEESSHKGAPSKFMHVMLGLGSKPYDPNDHETSYNDPSLDETTREILYEKAKNRAKEVAWRVDKLKQQEALEAALEEERAKEYERRRVISLRRAEEEMKSRKGKAKALKGTSLSAGLRKKDFKAMMRTTIVKQIEPLVQRHVEVRDDGQGGSEVAEGQEEADARTSEGNTASASWDTVESGVEGEPTDHARMSDRQLQRYIDKKQRQGEGSTSNLFIDAGGAEGGDGEEEEEKGERERGAMFVKEDGEPHDEVDEDLLSSLPASPLRSKPGASMHLSSQLGIKEGLVEGEGEGSGGEEIDGPGLAIGAPPPRLLGSAGVGTSRSRSMRAPLMSSLNKEVSLSKLTMDEIQSEELIERRYSWAKKKAIEESALGGGNAKLGRVWSGYSSIGGNSSSSSVTRNGLPFRGLRGNSARVLPAELTRASSNLSVNSTLSLNFNNGPLSMETAAGVRTTTTKTTAAAAAPKRKKQPKFMALSIESAPKLVEMLLRRASATISGGEVSSSAAGSILQNRSNEGVSDSSNSSSLGASQGGVVSGVSSNTALIDRQQLQKREGIGEDAHSVERADCLRNVGVEIGREGSLAEAGSRSVVSAGFASSSSMESRKVEFKIVALPLEDRLWLGSRDTDDDAASHLTPDDFNADGDYEGDDGEGMFGDPLMGSDLDPDEEPIFRPTSVFFDQHSRTNLSWQQVEVVGKRRFGSPVGDMLPFPVGSSTSAGGRGGGGSNSSAASVNSAADDASALYGGGGTTVPTGTIIGGGGALSVLDPSASVINMLAEEPKIGRLMNLSRPWSVPKKTTLHGVLSMEESLRKMSSIDNDNVSVGLGGRGGEGRERGESGAGGGGREGSVDSLGGGLKGGRDGILQDSSISDAIVGGLDSHKAGISSVGGGRGGGSLGSAAGNSKARGVISSSGDDGSLSGSSIASATAAVDHHPQRVGGGRVKVGGAESSSGGRRGTSSVRRVLVKTSTGLAARGGGRTRGRKHQERDNQGDDGRMKDRTRASTAPADAHSAADFTSLEDSTTTVHSSMDHGSTGVAHIGVGAGAGTGARVGGKGVRGSGPRSKLQIQLLKQIPGSTSNSASATVNSQFYN